MSAAAEPAHGGAHILRAENEALRQTLLACQEKLRAAEERAARAEDQIEAESSAREAAEKTLLSLERVREQGENVVKVEMDMRKDLGRDLVTAMETVGQLEKQLGTANKKLKDERSARKNSAKRVASLATELEKCRGELSATKGKLAANEHEGEMKHRLEDDLHGALEEVRALRTQLTASTEEKAELTSQMTQLRQESEAMKRHVQYQLMQSGNEARLKEHLQARSAEDFQAFRAQASAEMAELREKMKRSKMAAVQAEAGLQEALAELRARERDVQNLSWRVDRISELLTAQQRMQPPVGFGSGAGAAGRPMGGVDFGGLPPPQSMAYGAMPPPGAMAMAPAAMPGMGDGTVLPSLPQLAGVPPAPAQAAFDGAQ